MSEHEYYTYGAETKPTSQSIKVGAAKSTPWESFLSFFVVKGVIKSEDPNAPTYLAEGYKTVKTKFERIAGLLDARVREFRATWTEGDAATRFFWFAGATLYGLDQWIDNIDTKLGRLTDLSGDIQEAHDAADDLETAFKAAYYAAAPPGASFYGFPPNWSLNNPKLKDDEEQKLKAAARTAYDNKHKEFLAKIIKVGVKLGTKFGEGAKWMGAAGKVPVKFQGPDRSQPWVPYSPGSPAPMSLSDYVDPLAEQGFVMVLPATPQTGPDVLAANPEQGFGPISAQRSGGRNGKMLTADQEQPFANRTAAPPVNLPGSLAAASSSSVTASNAGPGGAPLLTRGLGLVGPGPRLAPASGATPAKRAAVAPPDKPPSPGGVLTGRLVDAPTISEDVAAGTLTARGGTAAAAEISVGAADGLGGRAGDAPVSPTTASSGMHQALAGRAATIQAMEPGRTESPATVPRSGRAAAQLTVAETTGPVGAVNLPAPPTPATG